MNGSSRARNVSSIVNQPNGGGNKKAGKPFMIGRSTWTSVIFNVHAIDVPLSNMQSNRSKTFSNMNLPVGFNSLIRMR
jgi:hypothetical protein